MLQRSDLVYLAVESRPTQMTSIFVNSNQLSTRKLTNSYQTAWFLNDLIYRINRSTPTQIISIFSYIPTLNSQINRFIPNNMTFKWFDLADWSIYDNSRWRISVIIHVETRKSNNKFIIIWRPKVASDTNNFNQESLIQSFHEAKL